MSYLETVHDVYRIAAETPDDQLCCVSTPPWNLPDLEVPEIMWEMNYGCGTTVQPRDIPRAGPILYIGVGGGLELLQFASLARRPGGVIGVDTVPEMIETCRRNLHTARSMNDWLTEDMVDVRHGDAVDVVDGLEVAHLLSGVPGSSGSCGRQHSAHRPQLASPIPLHGQPSAWRPVDGFMGKATVLPGGPTLRVPQGR